MTEFTESYLSSVTSNYFGRSENISVGSLSVFFSSLLCRFLASTQNYCITVGEINHSGVCCAWMHLCSILLTDGGRVVGRENNDPLSHLNLHEPGRRWFEWSDCNPIIYSYLHHVSVSDCDSVWRPSSSKLTMGDGVVPAGPVCLPACPIGPPAGPIWPGLAWPGPMPMPMPMPWPWVVGCCWGPALATLAPGCPGRAAVVCACCWSCVLCPGPPSVWEPGPPWRPDPGGPPAGPWPRVELLPEREEPGGGDQTASVWTSSGFRMTIIPPSVNSCYCSNLERKLMRTIQTTGL